MLSPNFFILIVRLHRHRSTLRTIPTKSQKQQQGQTKYVIHHEPPHPFGTEVKKPKQSSKANRQKRALFEDINA